MITSACLGVAAAVLGFLAWVAYDIRCRVRDAAEPARTAGRTVNNHLPAVVEKTQATTETLADLSADLRQRKELAGATGGVRDQNLVAYAEGALRQVEASRGTVGRMKVTGRRPGYGPARRRCSAARAWAAGSGSRA